MNRREAIRATTLVVGGLLLTSNGLVLGCAREREPAQIAGRVLNENDQTLIEQIADTLLPTTPSSPGAAAAHAGAEINLLLSDCYETDAQVRVVNGLKELRQSCDAKFDKEFGSLAPSQREALLRDIDATSQRTKGHYFPLVRELAERVYFSSEIGMTKAHRWTMEPGKWIGCVPLTPGQPAWG